MSEYKADLIKYYPEFLRENHEYNAICDAVNPEFDLLFKRLNELELNILPQTADTYGIEKYEQWLGILSNPYLDIETRRAQVLAKLNETLPYTEIRLQRMLAAVVGWGHFIYERHGAFVRVSLDQDSGLYVVPVREMLERVLPMNLHFEVVLKCVEAAALVDFASVCQHAVVITTPIDDSLQKATVYHGAPYLETVVIETGE